MHNSKAVIIALYSCLLIGCETIRNSDIGNSYEDTSSSSNSYEVSSGSFEVTSSSYTVVESTFESRVGVDYGPWFKLTREEINLQYVCSGTYDIQKLCEQKSIKKDTPYTYWEKAPKKSLQTLSNDIGLVLPNDIEKIDYAVNNAIISFGRKIVDIEFESTNAYGGTKFNATVTYAEAYEGAVVFVYTYDIMELLDVKSPCYIMSGGERVFLSANKYTVNEHEYN